MSIILTLGTLLVYGLIGLIVSFCIAVARAWYTNDYIHEKLIDTTPEYSSGFSNLEVTITFCILWPLIIFLIIICFPIITIMFARIAKNNHDWLKENPGLDEYCGIRGW